jgi:hypothetical protein
MRVPRPEIPTSGEVKKITPIDPETAAQIKKQRELPMVFSFQFFDRNHELFNLGNTCTQWFASLSDVLNVLSKNKVSDLYGRLKAHFDPHPIDWECTNAKFHFDDDWLVQHDCVQIRLSTAKGRIHGFILGNCFYIVWLDPHHNLWIENKDKSFGGVKHYAPLPTCVEEMSQEIIGLKQELKDYKEAFEKI